MKINDVYSSDLLKAADLQNMEHTVVIATVEIKDYDDGKKLLLTFQQRKKAMVLNKTNARRIATMHGDETDNWIGREIVLYPDLVDMQGKTVEAIRVRAPLKRPPAQNASQQTVEKRPSYELSTGTKHPNAPGNDLPSDDIPF